MNALDDQSVSQTFTNLPFSEIKINRFNNPLKTSKKNILINLSKSIHSVN